MTQCALWYFRYYVICVMLHDSEREAVETALAMSDAGEASIAGVQYADGRFVHRREWSLYREIQRQRWDEEDRLMAETPSRPEPQMRSVVAPFTNNGSMDRRRRTIEVPVDYPDWIGEPE
jgi:hypothetical protein